MPSTRPTRRHLAALSLAALACAAASAQTPGVPSSTTAPSSSSVAPASLPAAQPTQLPTPPQTPAAKPAYRARVDLSANQLSVVAENSSLNDILREISRLTGMKITGGVTDERVFGTYAGTAQDVLGQLLDGTGSNVLFLEGPQHGVQELVLTPRHGGPTPPNPNAARDNDRDDADLPPQLGGRRRGGRMPERDPNREINPPQPVQPPAPATTPDATTQQSPNGVKTPQEIFDELQKRQQQQQQTTPPQ